MKTKNYPLYATTEFRDFRVMVENVSTRVPDNTAYSYRVKPTDDEKECITYAQVRSDVRNVVTCLHEMSLSDSRCAIISEANYGWPVVYYSLAIVGAISVPLDKDWAIEDLISTVKRAECTVCFYGPSLRKKLPALKEACPYIRFISIWGEADTGDTTLQDLISHGQELVDNGDNSYLEIEIDPDKLSAIVFTSGTTGKGKGVMLSQNTIGSDMTQGMYLFDISRKTMNVLPLHHTFGSTIMLVGHFAQGCEIYLSSGLRYIAKEMKQEQPEHLVLVPLFVENLYKKIMLTAEKNGQLKTLKRMMQFSNTIRKVGLDVRRRIFSSILEMFGGKLNMIICGGAALNQDIIDTFDAIGITILNGYGITECSPLITCNRNLLQKKGSVGIPIIGAEVKIADPNEFGEGEICAKGPNVMLGYYQDEDATAEVIDNDGFFHTGDLGKKDDDGWVYITGRKKNLIILSNGKNVYPEELETEISRIFGVNEVVVYAGESKQRTEKEVIVAEIFPDYEALALRGIEDVQAYFSGEIKRINEREPAYKNIGHIKIRTTEFIKNTSKKITRFNIDKSIDEPAIQTTESVKE